MKLAIVTPGGFGREGDAHRDVIPALNALVAELAARHEVHVFAFVSPGEGGQHAFAGARIHRVEYPWFPDEAPLAPRVVALGRLAAQLARGLLRESAAGRFDCIHAFWANEPGILAGLLGRATRLPIVLSVGGGEAVWLPEIGYGGAGSIVGRAVGALAFGMAHVMTAGTSFARARLPEAAARRTRVVPLGIDWRRFDSPPRRAPGPPWRLLHVANLNAVKDQTTLLAAFAEVAARIPGVSLDCVGAEADGGAAAARARALGLEALVRFHGLLPPDRLPAFYREAHLHVLASRYESQGVVVLEAGAAGLPTVGTAVGLLPELAPAAARCVSPGDAHALADAICSLVADQPAREAMGAAAQAFARAHDAVWTARSFEAIYDELARSRPRASASAHNDPQGKSWMSKGSLV